MITQGLCKGEVFYVQLCERPVQNSKDFERQMCRLEFRPRGMRFREEYGNFEKLSIAVRRYGRSIATLWQYSDPEIVEKTLRHLHARYSKEAILDIQHALPPEVRAIVTLLMV